MGVVEASDVRATQRLGTALVELSWPRVNLNLKCFKPFCLIVALRVVNPMESAMCYRKIGRLFSC